MKYLATLLLILGFGLSAFGQTIKSLGYNTTNGQVVANTGTNVLTFTNETRFGGGNIILQSPSISWAETASGVNLEELYLYFDGQEKLRWREEDIEASVPLSFSGTNTAPTTRANLGFSTNLSIFWTATNASDARSAVGLGWSALTNTNATNFRTAIGLGATNNVTFNSAHFGGSNGISVGTSEARFTQSLSGGASIGWQGDNQRITFDSGLGMTLHLPLYAIHFGTNNTNGAAITRTNLGLGWSALTNTNAATSLLGFTTNGQVVADTTNTLTFTNRFWQSSTNATNPPEIRLTTKSNNVASWFVYDAVQTNPAAPNWSVAFMGLNTVPKSDGTDRALLNQSIGGASFTIENMWVSPAPDPDAPLAEFYFNITDTNNLTTRGFSVIGNQTNSEIGFSDFRYPVTIFYNSNSRAWYGSDTLGLNVFSTNTGELARFTHSTTNPSGTAQIYLQVQNNQTIWLAGLTTTFMRNYGSGRNVFRADSNGVIYGATGANDAPQAPVHLAGNTRIDGAISFDSASNAAITRTNLGLGATNTVTFSNVVNNGNFTNNNGTIYGLKTNVGPFEGIGNFLASNNTTVGNETLFRVGVAETTNKSAQFGFRVTRTNNGGEGLAVFSVFGYNALMMIGPSDRSRSNSLTNTNAAIEADIWTMSETNRVMTLRDTNTGAMVMHRPIGINTDSVNTNVPSNTTNVAGWIEFYVGTNSVRVPYYQ